MKNALDNLYGHFTWDFGNQFYIETEIGNFIWSSPSYNGDGSIKAFYGQFIDWSQGQITRDKGYHKVSEYIGVGQ